MLKYNKIATISKKVADDYIPMTKFTHFDTPDYDVFMAIVDWVSENIPVGERENIFVEVDTVELDDRVFEH